MTPRAGEIQQTGLPRFHPATVIRKLGNGQNLTIADATSGVLVLGATGGGKTSGTGRFLSLGYLGSAAEMGFIVLCSKPTELPQWLAWAAEVGRLKDVRVFDASAKERFNFLLWEAAQAYAGGGLTINVVALLEEIITALEPGKSGGGENVFFEDALHQLLTALVDLLQLAGYELSVSTLRDIARSAPLSREQAKDKAWQKESACWFFLEKARLLSETADEEVKADYAECRAYWLEDFANLSEKTRSIIILMLTKLAAPFTARPLRKLVSTDITIRPEDTFDGKIIIVAVDTQSYRLAGRMINLIWKYCFQVAVMRRPPAPPGEYLRPVCCWADEAAENFLSKKSDSAYQAVARSSAGCTVHLAQNISQYKNRLGDSDAFEALAANLQTKFFHQNTGPTNKWASELLGERWEKIAGVTTGNSISEVTDSGGTSTSGVSISEQHRFLVEPAAFTTLKRGGAAYNYEIEAILYKGGAVFSNGLPYLLMRFKQC